MGVLDDIFRASVASVSKNVKNATKKSKKKKKKTAKKATQTKSTTQNSDKERGGRDASSSNVAKVWERFGREPEKDDIRGSMRPVDEDKRRVDSVALRGNTGRTREELERIDTQRELERQVRREEISKPTYNPLVRTPVELRPDTSPEIDNYAEALLRKFMQGAESTVVGHLDANNANIAEDYLTGDYKKRFVPGVRTGLRMNVEDPELVKKAEEQAKEEGYDSIEEWEVAKANEYMSKNDDYYHRKALLDTDIANQEYGSLGNVGLEISEILGSMVPSMALGNVSGALVRTLGLTGKMAWALQGIITGGEIADRVSGTEAKYIYDRLAEEKRKTRSEDVTIEDYRDMIGKAKTVGELIGIAEAGTEMLFGGLAFMGKGLLDDTVAKIGWKLINEPTKEAINVWRNTTPGHIISEVVNRLNGAIGEGMEEAIMAIAQPAIEKQVAGIESEVTLSDIARDFGLGAAVSLVVGIPITAVDAVNTISEASSEKKAKGEFITAWKERLNDFVESGDISEEEASKSLAEAEDILAGKGSLNVSSAVPEEKVAGEALDTVYDSYEEAKKAMMQEARTKKDGEKIVANYIDNGVVKTFTTTAKGGTLGLGRSTEAGKEYQRIAQAKNVTERSGYQLNVKEEIIKEVASLSKAIGREVEFYRNDDATDHGYMDKKTGKIYINAGSSQSAARSVIAHELTHQMESTAGWSKLVELMKKHYGSSYESRRQERIDAYEAFGKPLKVDETRKTYDEADQELVAMFVEEKLLTDADTIREVVNTDKTLAQKIIAWINKVIQKLAGSKEQKMLVEARDLWSRALKEEQSGNKKAPKEGAGERHSFGGERAETADTEALEKAKAMAENGEKPGFILRETGWFVGTGGRWRYEIDDSKMQYFPAGRPKNPDAVRLQELYDKFFAGSIEQEEIKELQSLEKAGVKHKPHTLDDYIIHDELFDAYPELKGMPLRFDEIEGSRDGYYSRNNREIVLDVKMKNDPIYVLVHEIQHAIQHIEGFPQGASVEYWKERINNGFSLHENDMYIARAEKEYNKLFEAAPWELQSRIRKMNRARITKDFDLVDEVEEEILHSEYSHYYAKLEAADFQRRRDRGDELTAKQLYLKTAGEIEARDVSLRRHMTAEERRNRMPFVDDDAVVTGENAIRYFANSETAESIKKQIRNHLESINAMSPVAIINSEGFTWKNKKELGDYLVDVLKSSGYRVDRQNFGTILFDEDLLREAAKYVRSETEAVSYAAIPRVLKRGVEIGEHKNHKGRGLDTVTFAAPVLMNEESCIVAVVVKLNKGNRLKVVRVLSVEGKRFDMKKDVAPLVDVGPSLKGTHATSIGATSTNSISDSSEKSNTRNSIGASKDAEYLAAVNRGDMGIAQRLVREAANIAGFTSPKLYHGTKSFGFTQLRTKDLDIFEWSPFFATPDPNLAETYSGETERRQLRGGYPKATQDQIDDYLAEYYEVLKKRIRAIDKHLSKPALPRANDAKRRSLMKDARNELANMVEAQDAKTFSEAYNRYIDADNALGKIAMRPEEEKLFDFDEIHEARWKIDRIISAEEVFITPKGKLVTYENREEIESDTAGIYSFYANLDGMLDIDGEGKYWNDIDGSKIGKDKNVKTRDVALYAKENGYTGVIIRNIYDSGGQTDYYEPGDIYIFFDPAAQVKSADTVTYDDNNEVIPLSERFNEENNDIRWSVGSVNKDLQEMVKTSNASMRDAFHNRRRADHKKLWDMIRAEELHIVQTGAVRRNEVDKIVQYAYETGYINNAAEEAETGENVWGKAIYVPEEYKGEIASLGGIKALNNQLRGSGMYFTHKKGAGGLDEAYSDLQSANPILPDTIDPAEQMEAIVDLFGKNDTRRTLEELDEEAYAMGEEDAPYRNEIKQVVESALDDISVMARYKMTQDARKKGISEGVERGKKAGIKEQQRKQLQADRQNLSVYDKIAKQRTKDERKDAEATMRMHDKLIESVRKEEKALSREDKKELQKLYKSKEKDWNKELKRQASEFKKEQRNAKKTLDSAIKQAEKERKDLERKLTAPQKKEMQKKQKDLDKARREERIRTAYNEYKRNSKPSEGSIESIYAKSRNARGLAAQMRRDIIKKIVELGKFPNANGMVVLDENGMEIAAQNLETGEWDVSKYKNTYTPPFGLTLLAEKEGMDKDVFYTVYSKIAELRSAKDENGKRLHKKEEVIEYISMLDLPVKQKNFLYFDVAKYPYTKMPTFLAGGSIKEKAGNKRGRIIEAIDNIALDMFRGTVKDSQVFTSEDDTVQIQNEDLLNIADIVFGKEQSEEKEDFIYYLSETVLNYATQMENIRLIEKTNLLTNKPKEKDDIKAQVLKAYRESKRLFVAEGEAFERMSDKMDDILITARYYAAKKAPAIANEMIFGKTQRDLKGEYKGKGLYEIFKPIFRADEKAKNDKLMTDLTELVNCRHDIYRLRNGKGFTGNSIEECEKIVARISEEHPELLKAADELAEYGRNLLRMCVESGRISQADYDYFTTKYPYYVPTFRVRSNEFIDRKGNVVRRDSKIIRTAKGGNEDVLPLFDQFVHRTQEIVKACKKNQLATEMVRHINVPGMEEYISEVRIAENQENKDSSIADIGNIEDVGIARREDGMGNVIPWYSNGKKYDIVVRDKNLLFGWDRINYRREETSIETALRKMNNIRRGVLTQYNPTFWITNSIKDYQDMYLYNQHAQWLPVYHAVAAKTMFAGTTGASKEAEERLQEYLSFGMSHASIFEYDNTTAGRRSKKTRTKEALTKPIELFDTLNFMTEQTPRFAVYLETYERLKEKQYKKGGNTLTDEEIKTIALYRAEDATLNFGRSGTVVKYMNTYGFTFINAGVQGMDRFRRMFVQVKDKDKKTMFINVVGLLAKMEIFGVSGGVILSLLYGGDDEWSEALREFLYGENADKVKQEYEEMSDYQKINYYAVNIGGVWIKIPRGRLAAFLYGPVYYGEKVQDGEMDMKELIKTQIDLASETILFSNPVTNNIAGPFIDVMLRNKDHWGNPIVSEYEDMGEGFHYLEYDEDTTDLAIAVADALRFWDLSPKKLDYIIEQYLGSYSDIIMPFLSKGQSFGDRAMDMLMSLAGKFYIDPTSNNRLAGDYYDLKEEYENIANASDGDSPYAVAVKFFNEDTEQLKYLRDQIKAINADTTISRRERLDEIAKLKEQMNIIYRDGVTGAEGILAYAMENYTAGADVNELYDAWIRDNMSAEWRVAHFNDTEMKRYNKITNAGCSSDNAVKAMDALAVLKPLEGESSVSDYQQVEAIAKLKLPAEEEVGAMAAVFNEKGYAKYTSMTPHGVTAQTWLDFEDALKEADKNNNGNGYYDNDEKKAALDSINASNSVRAVLWQSKDNKLGSSNYDTAWKAGRNPYDPGVASKMIDDYMAKIAGMEEEEEDKQYLPLSADYRISGEYGENRGDHIHSGIDLAIPEGSDVHAVMSGTISFAGWKGGYGYRVVIDHPDGTQTAYSHLSDIGVSVGDEVDAGTVVALSGNTGYSTGPHLHFEVIEDGEYVNPEQYFDFGNGLKAEGDGNYVSQMSAVSGGYSGGGGSSGGGSSRSGSTASVGSRTSQVVSNRRSGGGIYLPTASGSSVGRSGRSSSVAGMSTSAPAYGTRGVYLPKASDYTSGGSSIRSSIATTQRTGRTGGSFWNENILS